jgi:hypothetical protein
MLLVFLALLNKLGQVSPGTVLHNDVHSLIFLVVDFLVALNNVLVFKLLQYLDFVLKLL